MIEAKWIMDATGTKSIKSAELIAQELNDYSEKYKVSEIQILDMIKKYSSKNTQELLSQQAQLKGKTETLKIQLREDLSME